MNTDPPYGIAYSDERALPPNVRTGAGSVSRNGQAASRTTRGREALQAFLSHVSRGLRIWKRTAAFYLWHPMLTQGTFFAAAAAAADILIHRQIMWSSFAAVRVGHHWQPRVCSTAGDGDIGRLPRRKDQTTIWTCDRKLPTRIASTPRKAGRVVRTPHAEPPEAGRGRLRTVRRVGQPVGGGRAAGCLVFGMRSTEVRRRALERLAGMGLTPS